MLIEMWFNKKKNLAYMVTSIFLDKVFLKKVKYRDSLTITLYNHIYKVQQLVLVVLSVVRAAFGSFLHEYDWLVVRHLSTVLVCVRRASHYPELWRKFELLVKRVEIAAK